MPHEAILVCPPGRLFSVGAVTTTTTTPATARSHDRGLRAERAHRRRDVLRKPPDPAAEWLVGTSAPQLRVAEARRLPGGDVATAREVRRGSRSNRAAAGSGRE